MTSDIQLIGFEKELGALFAQSGVFQDYRATFPDHLLGVLKQQHPIIIIESIELLDTPKCKLGGMQQPDRRWPLRREPRWRLLRPLAIVSAPAGLIVRHLTHEDITSHSCRFG
jgi:hypothetical protein